MTGPVDAPRPRAPPAIAGASAALLAYYASVDEAVLAPRGWSCRYRFGSSGDVLTVTPKAGAGSDCPGVVSARSNGGTSGRFEVAKVAARIFPSARSFVQDVINEHLPGSEDIHFGAYGADKVIRLKPTEVEYETPPQRIGLGSDNGRHAWPIRGWIALQPKPDMDILRVDVCLPPAEAALTDAIVKAFEADVHAGKMNGD
jgi:hypothetical protein